LASTVAEAAAPPPSSSEADGASQLSDSRDYDDNPYWQSNPDQAIKQYKRAFLFFFHFPALVVFPRLARRHPSKLFLHTSGSWSRFLPFSLVDNTGKLYLYTSGAFTRLKVDQERQNSDQAARVDLRNYLTTENWVGWLSPLSPSLSFLLLLSLPVLFFGLLRFVHTPLFFGETPVDSSGWSSSTARASGNALL
jgi:hypothetical protein